MQKINSLALSAVVVMILSGCDQNSHQQSEFQTLRAKVMAGQYDQAIEPLENLVEHSPASKRASRAGLFLFKSYFAKQDYENAHKWCDWTIAHHPNSLEARKCQFKKALIFFAEQDFVAASRQFQSVASDASNPLSSESRVFVKILEKLAEHDQQDPPDP